MPAYRAAPARRRPPVREVSRSASLSPPGSACLRHIRVVGVSASLFLVHLARGHAIERPHRLRSLVAADPLTMSEMRTLSPREYESRPLRHEGQCSAYRLERAGMWTGGKPRGFHRRESIA